MERDLLPNTWKIDLGSYGVVQGNFDNDDIASRARNSTSETAPLVNTDSTSTEEESDTDDEDKLTPSFFWRNQNLFIRLFTEMEALEGRLAREVVNTIRIEQMLKKCRAEGQQNIRNLENMLFALSLNILESTSKQHMLRKAREQIFYVYKRAVNQDKYENIMDDDHENIVIKSLRTVMKALGCSDTEDSDNEDKSQDEEVSENEGAAGDQESADEDEEELEESKVQMHDKGKSEYKKESDDKRKSEYKKESDDKGNSEYKNEPDDRVESNDKKQSDVRDDSNNRSESVIMECSDIAESPEIVESAVIVECSQDTLKSSVVMECSDIVESEEECKYYLLCDDEESDYKEESECDQGLDSEKDFGDDEASADDESNCF